ncbi:uncharacterized protein [Haliotis cracherodii]|uniref:uncharacterized protein n=1 Tax=Haliotis cracherodii TaxID=6455 RepID=UPI0039EB4B8C
MKTSLLCVSLMVVVALTSADLLSTLNAIHASDAFKHLPPQGQLLMVELMSEAAAGQLHAYVAQVGIDKIFLLLSHLPEHEEALVVNALNKALQHESHPGN